MSSINLTCGAAEVVVKASTVPGRPSALRRDVVVEVEDVVRVVPALYLAEPVVVRAVRCADGVLSLIVAEVVEPATGAEMRSHRRERLAAPRDVRLAVGRVRPNGGDEEIPAFVAVRDRGLAHADACDCAVEVLEQDACHR